MFDSFSEQDKPAVSSDPCQPLQPVYGDRFVVMTLCFLVMFGGAAFLFPKSDQPYRVQIVSVFIDTAAVILYTFSSNKNGMRPFMFSCPVVLAAVPRLLWRHLGFLAVLVIVETVAFRVRPYLPSDWTTASHGDPSGFAIMLWVLCGCLALTQVLSNRSVLETAHLDADKVTG